MLDKATQWLVYGPATLLNHVQDVFALAIRFYVGWQFFKAGQLKINSWSNTLQQFQFDFQVPLLPPYPAAVLGTFGELFSPCCYGSASRPGWLRSDCRSSILSP